MQVGYKVQHKFDFSIFLPVLILMGIGLAAVYSSTLNHPTAFRNFDKQLFWVIFSTFVMFFIYLLPQQTFRYLSTSIYSFSMGALLLVLVLGKTVYGAKSWLSFGPFGFQPSEFAKIGLILMLAKWLTHSDRDINNIKDLGIALSIGILPVLLILFEPDMGTAIVFIAVTLVMIFWAGISLFGLFVVLSPGITALASLYGTAAFIVVLIGIIIALIYFKQNLFLSATIFVINLTSGFLFDYGVKLLQPHQQKRIETFLDPTADPLGAGYNSLQAQLAIGSGGLFGKGFLEGNQTQLRFIPAQWTDFIFCVIGEEFGFIGSILTILLFLVLFLSLLSLSAKAKDKYSKLVVIGTLTLLFIHFAINIGMNVGIAPVIGIPLPFISYGGSSLFVNMVLIGIVMNIHRNRIHKT